MSQKSILIIDDDPSFLQISGAILEQAYYLVDTATNTTEGLKKIEQNRPDVLILDINMATIDEGLNFAGELKARRDLRDIPIIIASARPDMEKSYKRTIDQDMDWIAADIFMEKPIDPQELLYNVDLLIKK